MGRVVDPRTEWCPQGAQGTVIGRFPAAAAYSHHAGVDSVLLGSGLAERRGLSTPGSSVTRRP
jgi:hypothetical protein